MKAILKEDTKGSESIHKCEREVREGGKNWGCPRGSRKGGEKTGEGRGEVFLPTF